MLSSCSLLLLAAQAGPILYEVDGESAYHGLGFALAGVPDINGDGVRELLAGGNRYGSPGEAALYDGATGVKLHSFSGPPFGEAVASAGDVDGDGVADFFLGDIFAATTPIKAGRAWVYSGASPTTLLHSFQGDQGDQYLGGAGCGLGDVNGDGFGDIAIGSWGAAAGAPFSGKVEIYSGADGSVLRTIDGTLDHGYFGERLDAVPDVDGDGVLDLVVGAFGETFPYGYNTGAAYLYSGRTGALLQHWVGPSGNARMGTDVAGVPDLDGDGAGEVLVGAMFAGLNGEAFLYSGATGALLLHFRGYDPDEVFGVEVDDAGDTNGDGVGDLVIGSDAYYDPNGITGYARIYSGDDGRLLQDMRAGGPTARLGVGVAGLGDVNADGLADVAVGAGDVATAAGIKAGRVYVFSGDRQGLLLEVVSLVAGQTASLRLSGCDPSSRALFAWSLEGPGPSASPFGPVDLSPPIQQLPPIPCDAQGVALATAGVLPLQAQGVPVWVQAAELTAGGGGELSLGLPLRVQ